MPTHLPRGVYRAGPPGPHGERILYAVDHRGLMVEWRFVLLPERERAAIRELWAALDALVERPSFVVL